MSQAEALPFKPQRALLSVSDKQGLIALAQALDQAGVELIATDSTAALIKAQGLPVTRVSEYTQVPELLDGRVKTLHPIIHAALLARGESDQACLESQGIKPIDLLVVNLYPFEQITAQEGCSVQQAIEQIDIGGPAMVRSAAKNHAYTYVITTPEDYPELIHHLQAQKAPKDWQFRLAKKAFTRIAAYDAAIANYLNALDTQHNKTPFPEVLTCQFSKISDLRYGENPHQRAVFYANPKQRTGSLSAAHLVQGKPLSYNNILDADAALDLMKSYPCDQPLCVIIKHNNPCGLAVADTLPEAYAKAFQADPDSAYGGIVAFNQSLDGITAQKVLAQQFLEVLIAPEISSTAQTLLAEKKNIRVLSTGFWEGVSRDSISMRTVDGGLLVQDTDLKVQEGDFKVVSSVKPTKKQMDDLLFAWLAAKHVKSNAIVYAKDLVTLGIGAGQSSRVLSAQIALWKARQGGFELKGAVMASDAFIPFTDTLEISIQAGISCIIQPGGSIKDEQIIAYAEEQKVALVFTGMRHFRH